MMTLGSPINPVPLESSTKEKQRKTPTQTVFETENNYLWSLSVSYVQESQFSSQFPL